MNRKIILLIIGLLVLGIVAMSGCTKEEAVPLPTPSPKVEQPPVTPPEEKRPMTYYSAKQALGHLTLYLREHKQASPKTIWKAIPERSALYSHGESGALSGIVGGWVFSYEDEQEKTRSARLNCWGEVTIQEEDADFAKIYPRAIRLGEWVLDNTDAHRVVIAYGGEGRPSNIGGWLMTVVVEGRGIRPVWAGSTWYMSDKGFLIVVDAQTGELYRPMSEKKLEPISPQERVNTEWDGGFNEESYDALMSRSEHYYWWPRVYQTFEGQYVYNRKLLKEKLQEEQVKLNRDAASWFTSGILRIVLGNWEEAIDDLDEAVKLEPENEEHRYYRGLYFLCIRDLDKANSDFQTLSEDNENRSDALNYLTIFQGKKERHGLAGFMHNIPTNCGMVPWEVWIGPLSLTSWHNK